MRSDKHDNMSKALLLNGEEDTFNASLDLNAMAQGSVLRKYYGDRDETTGRILL